MKIRLSLSALALVTLAAAPAPAQDLGPHFTKVRDGIWVQTAKSAAQANSNASLIVTTDGIVLVDTGQSAVDSREIAEAIKKLGSPPVRFIINTETHPDHAYGHFLFSPPAVVINHEGAGKEMRESFDPKRQADLEKQSPEMAAALQGFKLVPPQVEFSGDKITLHVGERTLEVLNLGTTHSLANCAVWLPDEKVLFGAAVAVEDQINTVRPHTNIPDMLAVMKMMRGLGAEVVVPGHGVVTTNKIFDNYSKYLETLLQRVNALMAQGRTLDQIKAELKMPEYESLVGAKERIPNNIEAAYRAIKGGYKPQS